MNVTCTQFIGLARNNRFFSPTSLDALLSILFHECVLHTLLLYSTVIYDYFLNSTATVFVPFYRKINLRISTQFLDDSEVAICVQGQRNSHSWMLQCTTVREEMTEKKLRWNYTNWIFINSLIWCILHPISDARAFIHKRVNEKTIKKTPHKATNMEMKTN